MPHPPSIWQPLSLAGFHDAVILAGFHRLRVLFGVSAQKRLFFETSPRFWGLEAGSGLA